MKAERIIAAQQGGVRQDQRPHLLGFDGLVDAKNVLFMDGAIRPRPAAEKIDILDAEWEYVWGTVVQAFLEANPDFDGIVIQRIVKHHEWVAVGFAHIGDPDVEDSDNQAVILHSGNGRTWSYYLHDAADTEFVDADVGADDGHLYVAMWDGDDLEIHRATDPLWPSFVEAEPDSDQSSRQPIQLVSRHGSLVAINTITAPAKYFSMAVAPQGDQLLVIAGTDADPVVYRISSSGARQTLSIDLNPKDAILSPNSGYHASCAYDYSEEGDETLWFLLRQGSFGDTSFPGAYYSSYESSWAGWTPSWTKITFPTTAGGDPAGSTFAYVMSFFPVAITGKMYALMYMSFVGSSVACLFESSDAGSSWDEIDSKTLNVGGTWLTYPVQAGIAGSFMTLFYDSATDTTEIRAIEDASGPADFPSNNIDMEPLQDHVRSLMDSYGHGDEYGSWLLVNGQFRKDAQYAYLGAFQADLGQRDKVLLAATADELLFLDDENDKIRSCTPTGNMLSGTERSQFVWRTYTRGGIPYVIFTNGVDIPKYWEPGMETYLDVPGAGGARALAVAGGRLVTGLGNQINMSDVRDFSTGWRLNPTMLTDQTPGNIVAFTEDGNWGDFLIWKEDAIFVAQGYGTFAGVSAPFITRPIERGILGPSAPNSIVSIPGGMYAYLGRDGSVRAFDGVRTQEAGDHIRRLVEPYIDEQRATQIHGFVDRRRQLLYFFYPRESVGQMDRGIVLDLRSWPWAAWPIEFPAGWNISASLDGELNVYQTLDDVLQSDGPQPMGYFREMALEDFVTRRWPLMIFGRHGSVYELNYNAETYQDDGQDISVLWKTGQEMFGNPTATKAVFSIENEFDELETGQTLSVQFEARVRNLREALSSSSEFAENLVSNPYEETAVRMSGRSFSLQYSGTVSKRFHWLGAVVNPEKVR